MTEYTPTPPSGMLGDGLYPGAPATLTRDEAVPTGWRYSINYGPDGEENFANVYAADGQFVGNLRTHHAIAICNAFAVCEKLASAPAPASGGVDAVAMERLRNYLAMKATNAQRQSAAFADRAEAWVREAQKPRPGAETPGAVAAALRQASDYQRHSAREHADAAMFMAGLASLSPAATPVSEAGPDWMEAQQVRKRRGVEIMQEYAWGNLTPLGVANHLKRAGFNIDYAQKIANDLAKPASSPAGGGVHEAAIGLLSELDAYCVGSRAYDRRVNEARRALKAALSQSTSAGKAK